MNRRDALAQRVCSGLAGWLQFVASQRAAHVLGENAAKLALAQIATAVGSYTIHASAKPPNWGSTKKRIDIALLPWKWRATTWYGAIEIKWPSSRNDVAKVREQVLQDAMRLASVKTANLNARFLVLGGNNAALKKLFHTRHNKAKGQEYKRRQFAGLFAMEDRRGRRAAVSDLLESFPHLLDRIPVDVRGTLGNTIEVSLMASARATLGRRSVGAVYVWQCNWGRGRRTKSASRTA